MMGAAASGRAGALLAGAGGGAAALAGTAPESGGWYRALPSPASQRLLPSLPERGLLLLLAGLHSCGYMREDEVSVSA